MKIALIRHAVTVAPGEPAFDAVRPLTAKGRAGFEREVRGLDRLGVRFDHVLHGPTVRCVQTAELLLPISAGEEALIEAEDLGHSPDAALLATLSEFARGDASVAVVGQQPWLGELLSLLISAEGYLADAITVKKGGVAFLVGDPQPGKAALVAVFRPRDLRQLGRPAPKGS